MATKQGLHALTIQEAQNAKLGQGGMVLIDDLDKDLLESMSDLAETKYILIMIEKINEIVDVINEKGV